MRHLDEGTIHAWLDGALDDERAGKAEEHAARCTQCALAVADARGLIAATSRILLSLDDVPAGVIPAGGRAAPPLSRPMPSTRNVIQPWMLKAAASLLVVATGALLVRGGALRLPSREAAAPAADRLERPAAGVALIPASPTPATTPAPVNPAPASADARQLANAPTPAQVAVPGAAGAPANESLAKETALAELKAKSEPTVVNSSGAVSNLAARPDAQQSSSVAVAEAERRAPSAASDSNSVASVAPKLQLSQTPAPIGGAAKRAIGDQPAALPPGMRMVSEQTITAQARVVQKRVYEVSPGVEVTLSIFGPPPARDRSVDAAAPVTDSSNEDKDEAEPGINTIKWSDSTGTDFRLSGRLPLDSLRVLRRRIPVPRHQ